MSQMIWTPDIFIGGLISRNRECNMFLGGLVSRGEGECNLFLGDLVSRNGEHNMFLGGGPGSAACSLGGLSSSTLNSEFHWCEFFKEFIITFPYI